jgi:hypothetical protein
MGISTQVLAILLSSWAAIRWAGLLLGVARLRTFRGPVQREARRACIARTALNLFVSTAAFFAWAQALGLRPKPQLTGFFGMLLVLSLVGGALASFMQPQERTPATLEMFRFRARGGHPGTIDA